MHSLIPNLALSTDVITGFCSETEEDHEDTVPIIFITINLHHQFSPSAHHYLRNHLPIIISGTITITITVTITITITPHSQNH